MSGVMGYLIGMISLMAVAAGPARATTQGMAQQVLTETNLARTEPHKYADHLRQLRKTYQGKGYWVPGSFALMMTQEGVPAVDEAIEFLSRQKPMKPLSWSKGLAQAAEELVRDEGASGQVGHDGKHSGSMRERIERHGNWSGRIGENIGYGPSTARLMVMELIIDDGVSGRGHRKNIFTSAFTVAGVACGPHPAYRNMCVMELAGGFHGKK